MTETIYRKRFDQSASKIGQWIHDNEPLTHDGIDIDHVVWKSERKCLRIIEEKLAGESLRPSQQRMLPLLASIIHVARIAGLVSSDSGVFVLWWWQKDSDPVRDERGDDVAKMVVQCVTSTSLGPKIKCNFSTVLDIACGREFSID
jgi:hypothetical protein